MPALACAEGVLDPNATTVGAADSVGNHELTLANERRLIAHLARYSLRNTGGVAMVNRYLPTLVEAFREGH